ncbi:MAG: serine hydrolase [Butyrivibrio sp.]|nr:serine hydrolase [Butyrivibrio sp.]
MSMLSACGSNSIVLPYSVNDYHNTTLDTTYDTFASDLCVVNEDIASDSIEMSEASCGGLFDLNNKETLYALNVNTQLEPASLTKVMTALVALKNASLDKKLVATSNVYVTESGAQKINLKEGDSLTLDQALRILLIYSANDVANLIAENVGGTIEGFVEMMNEEAISIGATRTHFANPHGLSAKEHYTTPYDMYLMFNAAMQYPEFQEIISMTEYSTVIYDSAGVSKDISVKSTNQYINGNKTAPSNITVIGGKTGTTNAAGHCLILLARDSSSNPYIAVIMRAESTDTLYNEMSNLLQEIVN